MNGFKKIWVNEKVHEALKILADENKMTVPDFIQHLLKIYMKYEKVEKEFQLLRQLNELIKSI
jgi:hypothetical protein